MKYRVVVTLLKIDEKDTEEESVSTIDSEDQTKSFDLYRKLALELLEAN